MDAVTTVLANRFATIVKATVNTATIIRPIVMTSVPSPGGRCSTENPPMMGDRHSPYRIHKPGIYIVRNPRT